MSENKLEIIISAVDEASDKIKTIADNIDKSMGVIKTRIESASKASIAFGNEMRVLGKTISSAGMTMSYFGAGITAPFILALNESAKHSTALAIKIDNLKAVFQDFQMKMATAVIPIVDRFSNIIGTLNLYLNSLNPAMVNTVMQTTMMVGIFLTFGGILTAIVGKVIALTANLIKLFGIFMGFAAANAPLVAIIGSVAILVALMYKFKVVADVVMNTFQILFLGLKTGFDGIVVVVNGAILGIVQSLDWVMQQVARLPGPLGDVARSISNSLQGTITALSNSVNNATLDIQNNVNTISSIFQTGTGQWADSLQKFIIKVDEVKNKIQNLGTTTASTTKTSNTLWKQQEMGVQSALSSMSAALNQAAAQNKKFALAAKITAIGLAIVNTAVGVTNALAVPPPWLGMALAAIVGAAGAIQIATIAATPMAEGGIVTRPTNALIGEAGPEAIIPLNKYGGKFGTTQNIHIEINNPIVRSDEDIDRLTEEVSNRLAREAERL